MRDTGKLISPRMMSRTILFVVHDYPPIRTTGAERPLRFSQLLPEFGYFPAILTTKRYGSLPSDKQDRVYRADDLIHNLFRALRDKHTENLAQNEQFRVATVSNQSALGRIRDSLLIPDTKIGWIPEAMHLGRRVVEATQSSLIYSSSPPESAHLIAMRLSKSLALPWVADLRDGWMYEPPNAHVRSRAWRQRIEERMERAMIRQAAAVVTTTSWISADMQNRYPDEAHKVHTITNGFMESEFSGLKRRSPQSDEISIVYTGSLAASRQGTSPKGFFAGLRICLERYPDIKPRVLMVGNFLASEIKEAQDAGVAEVVRFLPRVPRREALQYQIDADILLLIVAPNQRSMVPLKLFEYIRAGRPILALVAENAAADIIQRHDLGLIVPPDQPEAIAAALADLLIRVRKDALWPGFTVAQPLYDRRRLTGDLARLFDDLLT
jgi:glycosyltransferase involved in cell wall biosynthesis